MHVYNSRALRRRQVYADEKFLGEALIALLKMRRNYSMKEFCTITDYGINKIRKVLGNTLLYWGEWAEYCVSSG